MSRSFKRIGHCKNEKSCKKGKQFANRRLRRKGIDYEIPNGKAYKKLRRKEINFEIPNGKAYKKLNKSWEICDYKDFETWESYKEWCERPRWWSEPKEANYFDYYKSYKMK